MKKNWTAIEALKSFLIALIAYFSLTLIIMIVQTLIAQGQGQEVIKMSSVPLAIMSIVLEISFLTPILFFKKGKKVSSCLKVDKKPNTKAILLCLLISFVTLISFLAFNNLMLLFLDKIGYNTSTSSEETAILTNNIGNLLISLVAYALTPAICEEFLFRGICYNGLKEKGTKFAIFLSAFLFMIMHMSLTQSIYQFALGIVFAIVICITDSIWYSISMHLFNNSFILIVSYIGNKLKIEDTESTQMFTSFWDYLLPFALLIVGGIIVFDLLKKLKKIIATSKEKALNMNNEITENETNIDETKDNFNENQSSLNDINQKNTILTQTNSTNETTFDSNGLKISTTESQEILKRKESNLKLYEKINFNNTFILTMIIAVTCYIIMVMSNFK